LGQKTNNTIASTPNYSTNDITSCSKTECENDGELIDHSLLKSIDNRKSKEDHLSQWADWKQVNDFYVPLRDSASKCCDAALRILSDEPRQRQLIDSYKKELLLDNMELLRHYEEEPGCLDGCIEEYDDLDDLDLQHDVHFVDDEIDLSTYMMESHIPLSDDNRLTVSSSKSSSHQNNPSINYQRELLLDGYFDGMNCVLTQFRHPYVEEQDDLLSEGDLESHCYDHIELENDDDEDNASNSSDSDCSAGYRMLAMHSCE
jgi:hypothetical protein